MKSSILIILTLFSVSLFAKEKVNKTFWGGLAVEGYDVISYFTSKMPKKGSEKYEYKYKDATWRFHSQENLELFKKNPEKYEPQYGGYCAYAVSQNSTAGIDPHAYKIVEDKLYLNYSQEVQKKWEANQTDYILKANAYWSKD